ncbi:HAD-IB family hydrolase [Marinomonas sp. 15G1-11]|uniref:HAD-IB family hydrolase n=1 Tax=Marinomonas phaeophyticola TaxID=3004091 RepID=A0ABT4JRE1_9GAMM|nr:HAD family hydrolase [Marinomonas sp. 15G1-11]MCZ2720957.1 HAD-IB family hydrolase [Marinomonas sp. 15G1-11]
MSHALYVFDLDGTLIDGDCASLWNTFLVKKGIVKTPKFIETERAMMAQYEKGEMNMEDYLSFTLAPITTILADRIDTLVDEFVVADILPKVFPEALTLINQLKRDKKPLLIISASVTFIVKKVASKLGIDQCIGIDLQMKENCYSNQISGIPSYREGKIQRLKDWVKINDVHFNEMHFYTDSINDLPLCLYANHTYLINPCIQLSEQKKHYDQWKVYKWGKVI